MSSPAAPIQTDALIIGAGPVGLFQVFELGLQDIHTHVVDVLPFIGGQCAELYADKPIYDIPALAYCTGAELVQRLQQQTAPFKPMFHLQQQVMALQAQHDGRWALRTQQGTEFLTKTVVIAAGVGAFTPRPLGLPALQNLEGQQVFHTLPTKPSVQDQQVVVVGGHDDAIHAALLAIEHQAASVTLLHRRSTLDAEASLLTRFEQAVSQGKLKFMTAQITDGLLSDGRLRGLQLALPDGSEPTIAVDQLWVALGLTPQLGPIAQWGLSMSRKQLVVNPENFSTSAPGVFAVGDVITYPGKRKLIVSGFHEATLAAFGIAAYLRPGEKIPLEYTTASPRLHRLLGV